MKKRYFYEDFHKHSKLSSKVINETSFTYCNVIKYLTKYLLKKHQKVLDYGCGVGTLSLYLASKGHQVLGLDVSKKAISIAKLNANLLGLQNLATFKVIENHKSPIIINQKYDLILCIEVIEHLLNDNKIINYFSKICKKNSLIILSTPSINAPLYRIGILKQFDYKVGHLRRYNISKLSLLLRNNGFQVIDYSLEEGIFRNLLFTTNWLGYFIKFIRGPITKIFMNIDKIAVILFGESNIYIVAQKV